MFWYCYGCFIPVLYPQITNISIILPLQTLYKEHYSIQEEEIDGTNIKSALTTCLWPYLYIVKTVDLVL